MYEVQNEEKLRTLAAAELNASSETDYRRHGEKPVCLSVGCTQGVRQTNESHSLVFA